jgi:hypothetical protein
MSGEKIWAENEAGIKILSLTEERLQEALQVMRESFYTDEPVAKGMKMSVSKFFIIITKLAL